jgi:hypothetical protein
MIGHAEWINSRQKNLKQGMSSGCCLTHTDCKIRMAVDLNEARGTVAKKFVYFSTCAQACAVISLLGTVICFVVQFVFINNVQLTQGTPFPMFLENTCICKNEICPEVLFTFTPPDVVEYQLQQGGFDVGPEESKILKYLSAWDFTNMHFTGNKKSSLSNNYDDVDYNSFRHDAEGGSSCYCDFYVTDLLRTTVPELGNEYDAPTWKIECSGFLGGVTTCTQCKDLYNDGKAVDWCEPGGSNAGFCETNSTRKSCQHLKGTWSKCSQYDNTESSDKNEQWTGVNEDTSCSRECQNMQCRGGLPKVSEIFFLI